MALRAFPTRIAGARLPGTAILAAAVFVGAIMAGGLTPETLLSGGRAQAQEVTVWASPSCGCCGKWVEHMRAAGFDVEVHDTDDLSAVKSANGVPETLGSCHTAVVDGYVLEGHVPAEDVRRLLSERPKARGLSVPGMPQSAPGMDIPGEPYPVILFGGETGSALFSRHPG